VVDNASGKSVPSNIRTSSGTFLGRGSDAVVTTIEEKIAEASHIPVENGEGVQILRYEHGQKYESHYDFFHDKFNNDATKGGQRVATMLMYLTDVEEGGETVFPATTLKPFKGNGAWSQCAQRGVAVKARRGDAILFWSLKPDGAEDTFSLHAGCPVIRGEKWSATKWMHVSKFQMDGGNTIAHPPGECANYNDNCDMWARMGECKKNVGYMSIECKKACDECKDGIRSGRIF